jgi:hypothetical protein
MVTAQCLAVTNKNIQCKRLTEKEYCYCHHYSHGVYKNHNGWLSMSYAHSLVKRNLGTIDELKKFLRGLYATYRGPTLYPDVIMTRTLIIVTCETLIRYRHLHMECEQSREFQKLVTTLLTVLKQPEASHLKVYSENIRKKLDKEYRLHARKKYILFFFKGIFHEHIAQLITDFSQ